MYRVRMVCPSDLEDLMALAALAGVGLTTLPRDPARLAERIDLSRQGQAPLLVLTEPERGQVVGTSGLWRCVGDAARAEPFYAYRLETSVHRSRGLGVHHAVQALHLERWYDGPTEVGTLFLHPDHRGHGNGRLLSLARFVLIASAPALFNRQIIAEMRGVIEADGGSAFWDAVGRHFFKVSFAEADALSGLDKRFIAELMPTHPIYVPLLPERAQRVIGRVHANTAPARRLLEAEGFHDAGMVDIFDAGPVLRCDRDAVRSIRAAEMSRVSMFAHRMEAEDKAIIAVGGGEAFGTTFGAVLCGVTLTSDGVVLPRWVSEALKLKAGAEVCVSPLSAKGAERSASIYQEGVS